MPRVRVQPEGGPAGCPDRATDGLGVPLGELLLQASQRKLAAIKSVSRGKERSNTPP